MSWADAATPQFAGVCPKCTGIGDGHYLTCPTLRFPQPPPGPPRARPGSLEWRPGSYEAAAQGCCCPVRENNHGQLPPDGWRITEGCPVHAPALGAAS